MSFVSLGGAEDPAERAECACGLPQARETRKAGKEALALRIVNAVDGANSVSAETGARKKPKERFVESSGRHGVQGMPGTSRKAGNWRRLEVSRKFGARYNLPSKSALSQ